LTAVNPAPIATSPSAISFRGLSRRENAMTDIDHITLLRQGKEVWNAWRKANPSIRPDLRGASLNAANLGGSLLRGADLASASLSRAKLSPAFLDSADLTGADLSGANFSGANLAGATSHCCEPEPSKPYGGKSQHG
jgi:uncharacterized protein YjbI with pentapeptide repeats